MKTSDEMVLQLAPDEQLPSKKTNLRFGGPRSEERPSSPKSDSRKHFDAAVIGRLAAISESGLPLVDFTGNPETFPILARPVVAVTGRDLGRDAVLLFDSGDPKKPILMAFLQTEGSGNVPAETPTLDVKVDGGQVTLSAKNEIVLRCGKASITLTRAGKVIIRGAYLLSRSSGVNRIKGGSVQIN